MIEIEDFKCSNDLVDDIDRSSLYENYSKNLVNTK